MDAEDGGSQLTLQARPLRPRPTWTAYRRPISRLRRRLRPSRPRADGVPPRLRAYVVDDERLAVERLSRLLQATGRVELAGSTTDPEEALTFLREHAVDVLFLDIQMPGVTGFELLEALEVNVCVIFTTAYDEHALRAFSVNSIDYLLKPI